MAWLVPISSFRALKSGVAAWTPHASLARFAAVGEGAAMRLVPDSPAAQTLVERHGDGVPEAIARLARSYDTAGKPIELHGVNLALDQSAWSETESMATRAMHAINRDVPISSVEDFGETTVSTDVVAFELPGYGEVVIGHVDSKHLIDALTGARSILGRRARTEAVLTLAHELEHVAAPKAPKAYVGSRELEEAAASTLSKLRFSRAVDELGASGVHRAATNAHDAYDEYVASLRMLMLEAGVDTQSEAGVRELLRSGTIDRVPFDLARRIGDRRNLSTGDRRALAGAIFNARGSLAGTREAIVAAAAHSGSASR